jgi:hypothetical protein
MLIGSTCMSLAVQRSLRYNRKAFKEITIVAEQITNVAIANFNLADEVERLRHRVAELEGGSSDAAQTRSQPRPLN